MSIDKYVYTNTVEKIKDLRVFRVHFLSNALKVPKNSKNY